MIETPFFKRRNWVERRFPEMAGRELGENIKITTKRFTQRYVHSLVRGNAEDAPSRCHGAMRVQYGAAAAGAAIGSKRLALAEYRPRPGADNGMPQKQ